SSRRRTPRWPARDRRARGSRRRPSARSRGPARVRSRRCRAAAGWPGHPSRSTRAGATSRGDDSAMIPTVHVITRLTLGGSSENTVSTIEALSRRGYGATLALGPESETATVEDARRRGCEIVEIPALGREVQPARDVAAVLALARLFRRSRPVIVHTHTSKAGFVGRLAARLARVPVVIHQPHGHIFYGYWGRARTTLFVTLERLAARWTDTLVALTPREVEEHVERGIGRAAQWAVVPSGVPAARLRAAAPSRAAARARLGLPADAFVVAGVGRLVPIKGFDLLVDALPASVARLPSAHPPLIGG